MPFGDRNGLLIASGGLLDDFLEDFGRNFGRRRRFLERNGHGIDSGEIFGLNLPSQIDLVEQHEDFLRIVGGQEGFFLGGEVLGGIDEANAQIGLRQGAAGAADAFLLDFAGRVAQSGGIHELQRVAVEDDGFLDGVAGGAGVGGDDGAVAAGQEVQEGGFADVGGTGDHDAGAVAQHVALVPSVQQGLDFAGNGLTGTGNGHGAVDG